MVFTAIYQTKTTLTLGSSFTSTHTLKDQILGCKISYSATSLENVIFNKNNGNFTIHALEIGKISFVITVTMGNNCGCHIPIEIDVVRESEDLALQYSYLTSYPYLTDMDPIVPACISYSEPYTYFLIGAPNGLCIDSTTGIISGKANEPGRFTMTITVINHETNELVSRNFMHTIFYVSNGITSISGFVPGHDIIHATDMVLKITCTFLGAPPTPLQTMQFTLSSPVIKTASLASYEISDDFLTFLYIVDLTNHPGSFPIILEDVVSGYFVVSNHMFTSTAACFNENTTLLTLVNDEEVYKSIKDVKVGDELVTYKHGLKKVTHIDHNTLTNNPDSVSDCMYKLSVSDKYPDLTDDLILLGRHSILVDQLTKKQKRKTMEIHPVDKIDDKSLLITMFNDDFEVIDSHETFTYYHLVLEPGKDKVDRRYGVYVNGGDVIAATAYKRDFLKQFPKPKYLGASSKPMKDDSSSEDE